MKDMDPVARAAVRRLAKQITKVSKNQDVQARASQAAFRGIHLSDGPLRFYNEDRPVGELKLSKNGGVILAPVIDAPPPQPNTPKLLHSTNLIACSWDGTFVGANTPDDLHHVEIHRSLSAGFTVNDVTQCGAYVSIWGGTAVFPANLSDGPWYFKLVAVDLAGNESVASAEASGTATADTWS